MAFGRPPLTRRALLAATLGALYALLLLPSPGTTLGVNVLGVTWFLLSLGLLFLTPLAYHVYVTWSIIWVVWRGVAHFRAEMTPPLWQLALDLVLPLASLLLLTSSGYIDQAREWRDAQYATDAR